MMPLESCFSVEDAPFAPQLPILLEQLKAQATVEQQHEINLLLRQQPIMGHQLKKIMAGSQFAAELLCSQPDFLLQLLTDPLAKGRWRQEDYQTFILNQLGNPGNEADLNRLLRVNRNRCMAEIIWRDFNRLANTQETCAQLTALAEACLTLALDFHYEALSQEFGIPQNAAGEIQPLLILGMGKLGAGELNLSSDIDLIFAFPDSGQTTGGKKPSLDNQAFFTKLGQKLIYTLDAKTADGFVFRVDMRLRPFGQSGALVSNFDSLEDYYHTQGREWERFAMVKARVVAHNGPVTHVENLMKLLRGFTYRRYVDFSIIDALRNLKVMITREVTKKGKEDDVKLGRGGIREIEFIAQAFQLIRGGRDTQLQDRRLIPTLRQLRQLKCLPDGIDDKLIQAYYFLRNTEHAIQGYQDRQTQKLPDASADRARIAWVMDFDSWESFWLQLNEHRNFVSQEFQAVIAAPEEQEADNVQLAPLKQWRQLWLNLATPSADDLTSLNLLQELGFNEPEHSLSLLQQLQQNPNILAMHAQGRERLDDFMPRLLSGLQRRENPCRTLARLSTFIIAVARRSAYLLLLIENPQALSQLITLSENSNWIAERLTHHPALLDELLNPASLYSIPTKAELAQDLRQQMLRIDEDDLEGQMENLRYFRWAHALKVAACEVTGRLPLMRVSDYLTELAEVIIDYVLHISWRQMVSKHGYPDGIPAQEPNFIVVGYGKLGGIELGHSSDLDLVFIHNTSPIGVTAHAENTGIKSLDNNVFFTRLAQKIIHFLATTTASGQLYEVDVRLRPSGNSGLLVSSLSAFDKYQSDSAWTWEHQALVRARAICGNPQLMAAFEQLRVSILRRPRDIAKLQQDVREMRQKMRDQLGSKKNEQEDGLFHLKQDAGGIVDIEFMVQYSALAWAHANPTLVRYTDNIRILGSLETTGRLESQEVNQLIEAYKDYRSIGHRLALQHTTQLIQRQTVADQIAQVTRIWHQLLGD